MVVSKSLATALRHLRWTAWQPVLFSGIFLALSLGGIAYFLTLAADRENETARANSVHLAETALGTLRDDIARRLADYAWWDDMVRQATAGPDPVWADGNIGGYLQRQFGYAGSYLLASDFRTLYRAGGDGLPADGLAFLGAGGAEVLRRLQGQSVDKVEAFTAFVTAGNGMYLFAAGPVTPEKLPPGTTVLPPRPILIFLRHLDREVLVNLGHNFLLSGIRLVKGPEPGGVALTGLAGTPVGGVTWDQSRPGDAMFGELWWKLGAVVAALVLAAVLLGYMWARAAIAANRAKSRFLAKMSHELLTPLNPIAGFAQVMREQMAGPLSDVYQDYAGHIHRSSLHLKEVVQDILDFSRIETGDLDLDEATIDLARLIAELPPVMMPAGDDGRRQAPLRLTLDLQSDLPPLRADARRVRQVLINLLSNAAKFGEGREVTLRVLLNGSGALQIEVIDQGCGIAPEDIKRAFEPFVQVGRVTDIYAGRVGTGIGLSIARELMELHGGRLDLESEPGRGTRAIMQFPAARTLRPA